VAIAKRCFVLAPFFGADGVLNKAELEAVWPQNRHAAFWTAEIAIISFADEFGVNGLSAFAASPERFEVKEFHHKPAEGIGDYAERRLFGAVFWFLLHLRSIERGF
jgi:hypothetical protein